MGCNSSMTGGAPIQSEEAFHAKYQLGRKVGEGYFGHVREAIGEGGAKHAVKLLHHVNGACGCSLRDSQEQFHRESLLWQQVTGHKNVVAFHEAFGIKETHYIVMEACKCSVLDGLKAQRLLIQDLSRVFRDMALGLAHCHEAGVVHRDVKPDNFLVGGANGQDVKLTDFGLATALPKARVLYDVAGTEPYMSPELLGGKGYDDKTDVWSLGVTSYVMLYGVFPYMPEENTGNAMKAMIEKGSPWPSFKSPVHSFDLPPDAVKFAKALLIRAKTRVSMKDVLKLSFLEAAPSPIEPREMASVLKMARATTSGFKDTADPTVQRSLDEVLQRLQKQRSGFSGDSSDAAPSWFSETPQQTGVVGGSDEMTSVTTAVRRSSRHSTHSGVSLCIIPQVHEDFCPSQFKDESDDDTDTSTRAPMPEEALPPLPRAKSCGDGKSTI